MWKMHYSFSHMNKIACLTQNAINKHCIPIDVPCEGGAHAGTLQFQIWWSFLVVNINMRIIHLKFSIDLSKPACKDVASPGWQALPKRIQILLLRQVRKGFCYYFNVYSFLCFCYYLASFISEFLGSPLCIVDYTICFPHECSQYGLFYCFSISKIKENSWSIINESHERFFVVVLLSVFKRTVSLEGFLIFHVYF